MRYFTERQISRLLSIPQNKLKQFLRAGIIKHIKEEGKGAIFDFKGLVAIRTLRDLVSCGISLRRIKRCLEKLRSIMPDSEQPLSEIRIFISHNREIILCKENIKFTPDGQLLINFSRSGGALLPLKSYEVEDLFLKALELDQQGLEEEAMKMYEVVIKNTPDHTDCLVNMGNILYKKGNKKEAEALYRRALMNDPDHIEANYNFANMLVEKGDMENAVLFYLKALHENPEFADACFNLAGAFERMGEIEEAKRWWLKYLQLNPSGEWADYVRDHIKSLEGKECE